MRVAFASMVFLAASLVFWIEPVIGKMVLPLLGGAPSIWNTCVAFFQAVMLAGYAYAHWLGSRFSFRTQLLVHLSLVIAAAIVFPPLFELASPTADTPPALWLVGLLLSCIGAPFFILATTSPLLQRWYARVSSNDPYVLSVASNSGSLIALLAFPFVLEPRWGIAAQTSAWKIAFVLYVAGLAACAGWLWRTPTLPPPPRETSGEQLTWARRLRWLAWSIVPSSLMLGVTTYMTSDVAPMPLLWVLPLALYLLTFVLAFATPRGGPIEPLSRALAPTVLFVSYLVILGWVRPLWAMVVLHLGAFFLASRVLHGLLARDRPHTSHLTEFYLWVSLGGVLAGSFNAFVAPIVFDSLAEYQLMLWLAVLLGAPSEGKAGRRSWLVPALTGLALLAGWGVLRYGIDDSPVTLRALLIYAVPIGLVVALWRRPRAIAMAVAPLLIAMGTIGFDETTVWRERSFFGLHKVAFDPELDAYFVVHGTTVHGMQRRGESVEERLAPLLYFHREGPLGTLFEARASPRRIAVVGLGAGVLAAYARPEDELTFYEIDPVVHAMATNKEHFTFLSEAAAPVRVELGDARLRLAQADESYDLLVIDAFSSDSIPIHLLTKEAIERAYLPRLAPGGWLVFHLSNRYLRLAPIIGDVTGALGLVSYVASDTEARPEIGKTTSVWAVSARSNSDLAPVQAHPMWKRLQAREGIAPWTDDFSHIASAFSD